MGKRNLVTKLWLAIALEIVDGDWRTGICDYVWGMGIVKGNYLLGLAIEGGPY